MKLLHTSDWHIGRTLYSKKERQGEHVAFFDWLLATIKKNSIDLLLVAGDIFDTSSPSSSSQKMYYDFLLKVRYSGCQNVVIVGGNHDSPSFLNATKDLLAALKVSVVGNVSENIEDEIVIIRDKDSTPIAVICAVPFLRARDISCFIEGETYTDSSKRISENIKIHYEKVAKCAEVKRNDWGRNLPIIATGHLSVVGGTTCEDDGVRETYIGNIECIGSEIFPPTFDYVALGHYHIAAKISENVRYSGSPIPMGFGEAEQKKSVFVIDFENNIPKVKAIEIPVFQKLESIRGDKSFIEKRLTELRKINKSVWVEVIYEGNEIFSDFTFWVNEHIAGTNIEILKLQNRQYLSEVLAQVDTVQSLDEIDEFDLFDKFLKKNDISDEQKEVLKNTYKEIVLEFYSEN
jgi:exonuclease SbcD